MLGSLLRQKGGIDHDSGPATYKGRWGFAVQSLSNCCGEVSGGLI